MARAFLPSPAAGRPHTVPPLSLLWRDARIDTAELSAFHKLTHLAPEPAPSLLVPHVLGFRLLMALLTERAYPLPIWSALQVRNQLRQHAVLNLSARFDIETRVAASRVLNKGLEVDLHTSFTARGELVWESTATARPWRGARAPSDQGG